MKTARVPIEVTVNFAGEGVVARPGDFMLLAFNFPLSPEEAERVKDRLASVAPDVRFAIVDRVSGVAIQRAEDAPS